MRFTFTVRLIMLTTAVSVLAVGLSSCLVYWRWTSALEKRLASELLAIVNSAAPLIDGDLHEVIYSGEDRSIEGLEEFELIRSQLVSVRDVNRLSGPGSPIYTMRAAADYHERGWLEFVVMTDPDETGHFFVGNRYGAEPHNRSALRGVGMASGIYKDAEGSWISAAAPIRNSSGEVVGLLQADRSVQFFSTQARAEAATILRFGGLAIVLGALVSGIIARSLTQPLSVLREAARTLGRNDFSVRLDISRSDEIGDLAVTFNDMAQQLQARSEEVEAARYAAEASAQAKSDLMVTMAGWIRTPVERIYGLTTQLVETQITPTQDKLVQSIRQEATSCLSLVDELEPASVRDSSESAVLRTPPVSAAPAKKRGAGGDDGVGTGAPAESASASGARRRASGDAETAAVSRLRVLVAEDNTALRSALIEQLRDLGVNADSVQDGRAALSRVESGGYDLILMDCQMPEMDGFEATRRIRDGEAGAAQASVVGMVMDADATRVQRCMDAGMDATLTKPLSARALRDCLSRYA